MQKRQVREQKAQLRWMKFNRERAAKRKKTRLLKDAQRTMKLGNIRGVLSKLQYIREQGDAATSEKLIEFILDFVNHGEQQAKVHQVCKKADCICFVECSQTYFECI